MSEQALAVSSPLVKNRILIIGFNPKEIDPVFKDCIKVKNHWEIFRATDISLDTKTICFYSKVNPEHKHRLRELGISNGIKDFHTFDTNKELRQFLSAELNIRPTPRINSPVDTIIKAGSDEIRGELRIPTHRIRPQPNQPRSYFNKRKLTELRESIRAIGQQQPVIVRKINDDPANYDYELIEGERRLRVCTQLEISMMLAIVREVADTEEQYLISFVANFAREGHTPMDTARAIERQLKFAFFQNLSYQEKLQKIGSLAGKSDQWARMHLKLLNLPKEVQDLMEPDENENYGIPLTLGIFLCSIAKPEIQLEVARAAATKKLTMNNARMLARKLAIEAGLHAGSAQRTPREDYKIMRGFLTRTIDGAKSLLDMPHRSLDELFLHRGLHERDQAIKDLEESIKLFTKIKQALLLKNLKK